MSTSPDNSGERQQLPSEELPSLEQLLATVPIEQLLYGVHIKLEDGEEECLVVPGPALPEDNPAEHDEPRTNRGDG